MKKVLIAEDDDAIGESLEAILEEEGYSVTRITQMGTVRNLDIVPDIILLDIWIGGQDGLAVCKHLKGQRTTKHVPILVMSANVNLVDKAKEAGADEFIPKPFEPVMLLQTIEKHLQ